MSERFTGNSGRPASVPVASLLPVTRLISRPSVQIINGQLATVLQLSPPPPPLR